MHVLVVEDEAGLRQGLTDLLEGDGHTVTAVANGTDGLRLAVSEAFDLLLLDWMLPGVAGIDICRRARAARPHVAILLLTARGDEHDKLTGLGDGADDYITKPFSPRELLARVRVLGRRHQPATAEVLTFDTISFDLQRLRVTRAGHEQALTPREVGIIRLLYEARGVAMTRAAILERVFGQRGDLETRAVDMAISVLRKKIEVDSSQPRFILSVKGAGYAWGVKEPRQP